MPTALASIVDLPSLGLRLLTTAEAPLPEAPLPETPSPEAPLPEVDWAHGSDLDDPTPFLSPGHLLLTTGRQFEGYDPEAYRAYVDRLTGAGVVALGFGTEVLRQGTPPELVQACQDAGLPLIEIPYRTPFIAVARAIADREAAAARARVEWALATQDAIARAVGRGGLSAAVAAAADALGAELWVLDADAGVLEHAGRVGSGEHAAADGTDASGTDATGTNQSGTNETGTDVTGTNESGTDATGTDVAGAALGVLRRGRRARIREPFGDGTLLLQTLGAAGRQHGVVALAHRGALDTAAESVVSTVAALAELALEHADDLRLGHRAIMEQLFQLLRDGRVDTVRRAADVLGIDLPDEPLAVVAAELEAVAPPFRDRLERRTSARGRRFAVVRGRHLLLLVPHSALAAEQGLFDEQRVPAGSSAAARFSELDVAVTQAIRALESATPGRSATFDDLVGRSVLGLLTAGPAAEVARARLAGIRSSTEGVDRLRAAEVWLRHNGRWEPAARELGLHRHSVKLRVEALGDELGLALDGFQGRAELWALLAAIDLDLDGPEQPLPPAR